MVIGKFGVPKVLDIYIPMRPIPRRQQPGTKGAIHMSPSRALFAIGLLAAIPALSFSQSSSHCDLPDADATSAHYDGAWKVSLTDSKTGEVNHVLNNCSNPVRLNALNSTELGREGSAPVRVIEVDGSTIMWFDERGQAFATKPLNGTFMLMRYGYGQNRAEYDQVLRYDRCPVAGSDCACEAAP